MTNQCRNRLFSLRGLLPVAMPFEGGSVEVEKSADGSVRATLVLAPRYTPRIVDRAASELLIRLRAIAYEAQAKAAVHGFDEIGPDDEAA